MQLYDDDDRSSQTSVSSMKRNLSRLDSWVSLSQTPNNRRRPNPDDEAAPAPAAAAPAARRPPSLARPPFPSECGWGHYYAPTFDGDDEPLSPEIFARSGFHSRPFARPPR